MSQFGTAVCISLIEMSNSVRNNKTMKPVICFICQTKCFFYYSNINSLKSKHTKRSIVEFIRIFVDDPSKFDENEFSLSSDKDDDYICYECMDKINVYDLAKSTAERIQAEMHKLLNQSKRKSTEVPPFFVGSELEQDSWNELEEEENDSSASSYGFDEDLLRPVKESQFRCYICSVDLRTTERFAEHQCLHENVPEMQCVYCGNSFKSKSGLWVHVTKHIKNELGEADYQCEYCGRTFITFQSLRSHLHTHVDCRTMECDICSFRCSTKAKLKKHMISHVSSFFS